MINSGLQGVTGGGRGLTIQLRERMDYHDAADSINDQFRTRMPRRGKARALCGPGADGARI